MNTGKIGKYFYIIPMIAFGFFHLSQAQAMAQALPSWWLPGGVFWVYITGITFLLAAVAVLINKKAKLATMLLGLQILGFGLIVQLSAFLGGDEMAMGQVLKDVALAGGAFLLSSTLED